MSASATFATAAIASLDDSALGVQCMGGFSCLGHALHALIAEFLASAGLRFWRRARRLKLSQQMTAAQGRPGLSNALSALCCGDCQWMPL